MTRPDFVGCPKDGGEGTTAVEEGVLPDGKREDERLEDERLEDDTKEVLDRNRVKVVRDW